MGYSDGSQVDHDRAFGESLSTEPDDDVVRLDCKHWGTEDAAYRIGDRLLCGDCEKALRKQLYAGELISKDDAAVIMRVMVRIQEQIDKASETGRHEDAKKIAHLFGAISYRQFSGAFVRELGDAA